MRLALWEFEPGVVLPLFLTAWLYGRGSRRSSGVPRYQAVCFWCGWAALLLALVSPLHSLGESLFSAHMVQHEMLMLVAAPLLVVARPLVPFLWALPLAWRRKAGALSKTGTVQTAWRFLTEPRAAWVTGAVALWAWHVPALFQLTLTSDAAHALQHATFLGTALLFWWSLVHGPERRMAYGMSVLYLFTTAIHTGILGALMTFSPQVWYPAYGPAATAWGLTPLEDQQLGGLIMWIPASLVYIGGALWLFSLWLKESGLRAATETGI